MFHRFLDTPLLNPFCFSVSIYPKIFLISLISDTHWFLISTAQNTVMSPKFLVWKFCEKAQCPYNFRRITWNYAETAPFHKFPLQKIRWNYGIFTHWSSIFLTLKQSASLICRSSLSQVLSKTDVLKKFAIFIRKHLCWSLFLRKLKA